ncbi:hypothetical protein ALC57_12758, partial [Trachymyrmex cornetzi]
PVPPPTTTRKTAEVRPPTTSATPSAPPSKVLRPMGPMPPPPVTVEVEPGNLVEVEPGILVEVPHFAAHVSRKYTAKSGNDRWLIRFNHTGTVRSVRKK